MRCILKLVIQRFSRVTEEQKLRKKLGSVGVSSKCVHEASGRGEEIK